MGTCSPTVLQGSYSTKCGTAAPRKVRVRASQDVQPGASRVPRINAAASPIGRHPIHVRSPLRGQSAYPLAQISHPGSFSVRGRLARSRRVGISRQHAAGDSCQAAGGDRDVPASPPSRQRPLHSLPLSDSHFFAQCQLRGRGHTQGRWGAGPTRCGHARTWLHARGRNFRGA